MRCRALLFASIFLLLAPGRGAAQSTNRITILYDAFARSGSLKRDWGFAALVEWGGKRILFDTGNNAEVLERNVQALKVDLEHLDLVVISHRHGDHIGGLNYLLRVNPRVRIYVPREPWSVFGGPVAIGQLYRHLESLPAESRYFDGAPPETIPGGTPWPTADFVPVESVTEIAPGIYAVPTVSQVLGTLELRELSLSLQAPQGQVLLVGCSHAGIARILEEAASLDQHVRVIAGGLHLLKAPDSDIEQLAVALRDKWNVERIALGHCTGEPAFAIFRRVFGQRYMYAGLGTVIELP